MSAAKPLRISRRTEIFPKQHTRDAKNDKSASRNVPKVFPTDLKNSTDQKEKGKFGIFTQMGNVSYLSVRGSKSGAQRFNNRRELSHFQIPAKIRPASSSVKNLNAIHPRGRMKTSGMEPTSFNQDSETHLLTPSEQTLRPPISFLPTFLY